MNRGAALFKNPPGATPNKPLAGNRLPPNDTHGQVRSGRPGVSTRPRWPLWVLCLLAVGLLLQAGCASLPTGVQRIRSQAIPAAESTTLGRIALASSPDVDLTGLRLLPTGPYALDTRLALVQRQPRLARRAVHPQRG